MAAGLCVCLCQIIQRRPTELELTTRLQCHALSINLPLEKAAVNARRELICRLREILQVYMCRGMLTAGI